MKAWIETGCFLCVASPTGVPNVTVARFAKVTEDDVVAFALSSDELSVIRPALAENPWVAFGASGVGGIRAAYQFKGLGTLAREGPSFDAIAGAAKEAGFDPAVILYVKLSELYCTKPGYEAGLRLDVMCDEDLATWDKAHWTDIPRK